MISAVTVPVAPPVWGKAGLPATPAVPSGHAFGCAHCGQPCSARQADEAGNRFCCSGCQAVFGLLHSRGLGGFYDLAREANAQGIRPEGNAAQDPYLVFDQPELQARRSDFTDGKRLRMTLRIPGIHCLACVWLLENLYRIDPGFGPSRVRFGRRELEMEVDIKRLPLSRALSHLASLGYPPELNLSDLSADNRVPKASPKRKAWLQLGVAGFAFGNTMLFSLADYLGMDGVSAPGFRPLVGWLSLGLTLPVLVFSAGDYWRACWSSLRNRRLNIEVPMAAGMVALFLQSAWAVKQGQGPGYADSLCALVFFLLLGRSFSRLAWDTLTFDRDYKSFFPLSVTRRSVEGDAKVALDQLAVGDRILLRPRDLIPADSRLVSPSARIDYSFVTGEAEPVERKSGDLLYAGGRQTEGMIEAVLVKAPSQSYLASMWDQPAFRKGAREPLDTLLNRYSPRFTTVILLLALGSALYWLPRDFHRSIKAFVSVLIVACPCALVLAPPFTLGTAQRLLARKRIFIRNPGVLECLSRIDSVVFDKTGTLTPANPGDLSFVGGILSPEDREAIAAISSHCAHPTAVRLHRTFLGAGSVDQVLEFKEIAGAGMQGVFRGRLIQLGSSQWLRSIGIEVPADADGALTWLAIDGHYRGEFHGRLALRPSVPGLLESLSRMVSIRLLTGDRDREGVRWRSLFGPAASLHFQQSPRDKIEWVQRLQTEGHRVMMVGDGLNDAGALRASHVGVAVVETTSAFSPASDVILEAASLGYLPAVLKYSREAIRAVRIGLGISTAYNVVGLSIAARGELQPVVCAILMPLSSVTVVGVGCLMAAWGARRLKSTDQKASSSL